jgi:RND superfamily putative drug exporter
MTRIVRALARLSARRAPWVVAAWVLIAGILIGSGLAFGGETEDDLTVPGSDSALAAELLDTGEEGEASSPVLLVAPERIEAEDATVAAVVDALENATGSTIDDPLADPARAVATGALSEDGAALVVRVPGDLGDLDGAQKDDVRAALDLATDAGWEAAAGGQLGRELDGGGSRTSEIIGIVAAMIVLVLALGSLVAMSIPIATGLLAVGSGLMVVHLLAAETSVPEIALTVATMIGLGVGIDYALFLVSRFRSVRVRLADTVEAVAETAATSGTAVLYAGGTVALTVLALTLTGVDFVSWIGYATSIIVGLVVLMSLTLTPALLALFARRLAHKAGAEPDLDRGAWARIAAGVTRRPVVVLVASLALLGVVSAPALVLQLGQSSSGDRPLGTEQRDYFDLTAEAFGPGSNGTLLVVGALDPAADTPADPRVADLTATLGALDGVAEVSAPALLDDGATVRLSVEPTTGPSDPETADLVHAIRDELATGDVEAHVGGAVATRVDLSERIEERLPWLVGLVTLAAAVVVGFAFRSVVLPLKTAIANLLSIAAALGAVVFVFQEGNGIELFGLDGPVPIDSYVPMMLFAILFGLSMDYEVFLLTAVRDHWLATGDAGIATRRGLAETGRIITSAAIIMVAVFLSFVVTPNPTVKLFGFGLAFAIFIDATVIRCLLVPAIMQLLGRWSWWWPGGTRGARRSTTLPA